MARGVYQEYVQTTICPHILTALCVITDSCVGSKLDRVGPIDNRPSTD